MSDNDSETSEKQRLIGEEESPPPYWSVSQPLPVNQGEGDDSDSDTIPCNNSCLQYLYEHRASIPGYGMLKLFQGSSVYSLYVLFVLLMAYLLNQLDRYTLPIVTTHSGYDLNYGDIVCMTNTQVSAETFEMYNVSDDVKNICSEESYTTEYNETYNVTYNVK